MTPWTIGVSLLEATCCRYTAKHDGQTGPTFLNQSAPIGLVLGEGLDDQHMFAVYGRARSGECIKARLCVTGDDDNPRYTVEDGAQRFFVKSGRTFAFVKVIAEKDYVWSVEVE